MAERLKENPVLIDMTDACYDVRWIGAALRSSVKVNSLLHISSEGLTSLVEVQVQAARCTAWKAV